MKKSLRASRHQNSGRRRSGKRLTISLILGLALATGTGCGLKPPLKDNEQTTAEQMWEPDGFVGSPSQDAMSSNAKTSFEMKADDYPYFKNFDLAARIEVRDICVNSKNYPALLQDVPGCFLFCSKFSLNAMNYDPSKTYNANDFPDLSSYCDFLFFHSLWAPCVRNADFADSANQLKSFVSDWGDEKGELSTYLQRFKNAKAICKPLFSPN